jgi:hypothetical protein
MPKVTKMPIMPKIKGIMNLADKEGIEVPACDAGQKEAHLTLPLHTDIDSSNTHHHFRHFRHL